MTLFLDLDGVLADFDTEYFRLFRHAPNRDADEPPDMWARIDAHGSFFRDMKPMPDAFELWDHVQKYRPTILTGSPHSVRDVALQKREWVTLYFGSHVPVIVCKSREKSKHLQAGDVLVDDWEKYRNLWLKAGGRWVTHRTARESIGELQRLGFA